MALLGPRVAILLWWLIQPARWNLAFNNFLVPLLGFLFLPWTTLMYVLVAPGGVTGFDWIWILIGVALDAASYSGGAFSRRSPTPATA